MRFLLYLLAYMPQCLFTVLVKGLTCAYPWIAPKEYRRMLFNTDLIFGLAPHSAEARSFAALNIRHQLSSYGDGIRSILRPGEVIVENQEEYARFIASQGPGPILFVTAHLGCWEILAQQTALSRVLHVLAKPSRFPSVTRLLEFLRARAGCRVLWNDSLSLLKDMLGVLQRGECLGFVMDQKPKNRVGIPCQFLGLPAEFVSGPVTLAIKKNCPILAVACVKKYDHHYRLIFRRIDPHSDEMIYTQSIVTQFEEWIRLYPEQWTWNYKRWKGRDPVKL